MGGNQSTTSPIDQISENTDQVSIFELNNKLSNPANHDSTS